MEGVGTEAGCAHGSPAWGCPAWGLEPVGGAVSGRRGPGARGGAPAHRHPRGAGREVGFCGVGGPVGRIVWCSGLVNVLRSPCHRGQPAGSGHPAPCRSTSAGRRLLTAWEESCRDPRWGPLCGRNQYLLQLGPGAASGASRNRECARLGLPTRRLGTITYAQHNHGRSQRACPRAAPAAGPHGRQRQTSLLSALEVQGAVWSEFVPDDAWLVLASPGFEDTPAAAGLAVVSGVCGGLEARPAREIAPALRTGVPRRA